MVAERQVKVDGEVCTVILSDESEILCSAYAKGYAVIGILNQDIENQCLSPALYIVDSVNNISQDYLERVVRRRRKMPWMICETKRLIVREFCVEDADQVLQEPEESESDIIFRQRDKLSAYINNQYLFHEYGIWAVTDKESGILVGKAGITDIDLSGDICQELGYHIFRPFRRRGYGLEVCRGILSYAVKQINQSIYARIDNANEASACLARRLGFCPATPEDNEAGQQMYLYERNCS